MINCTHHFTAHVQNLIESVAEYERQKAAERERLERTYAGARQLIKKAMVKQQSTRDRILATIAKHSDRAPKEISELSGCCLETTRLHLRRLAAEGAIINVGRATRPQWRAAK